MVTGTAPPRPTVSDAVERGGQALYAAAMPRGATPWERHSHAFQGIYLERSGTVLAAGLDVQEMAEVLARVAAGHVLSIAPPIQFNGYTCTCGAAIYAGEYEAHLAAAQAEALRAYLLGGAA